MINLNFTEKELETLQEYFQSELFKAEQKIDNIRGILGKIGKKYGKAQKNVEKIARKRGRPKIKEEIKSKEKALKKSNLKIKPAGERKKPGPKPKVKTAEPVKVIEKKSKRAKASKAAPKKVEVKTERKKPGPKPKIKPAVEIAIPVKVEGKKRGRPATKKVEEKKKVRARNPVRKSGQTDKFRNFPWQEWIINVLREKNAKLGHEQIVESLAAKLQFTGKDLEMAKRKVKDNLARLTNNGKISKVSEDGDEKVLYSANVLGE
jgi:hypothetical protein